jgi:hypothetical protein
MKRRLQFLSLAALALGASVVAAPGASAQDAGTASVVIVHGLRGFTADVYVDGTLLISTFRPERSTDPMAVPAGSHLVEIREAGTGADTTPAVTATIDLAAGSRYDAVAHVDQAGTPKVSLFLDDVSPLPPGQARAVVRNTAATGPIDVRFGPTVAASGLANGAGADTLLPAGEYEVAVAAAGSPTPITPTRNVTYPEGTATFMYLIGSSQAQTLDWLAVQATGLQTVPTKVPTGDGSVTQTPTESNGSGGAAIGLGAVVVFFAVATIRRLRRTA